MGSLFSSSSHHRQYELTQPAINQVYNVEFGYAPVGPPGPVASVPKRNLYNMAPPHRHRRRRYGQY